MRSITMNGICKTDFILWSEVIRSHWVVSSLPGLPGFWLHWFTPS